MEKPYENFRIKVEKYNQFNNHKAYCIRYDLFNFRMVDESGAIPLGDILKCIADNYSTLETTRGYHLLYLNGLSIFYSLSLDDVYRVAFMNPDDVRNIMNAMFINERISEKTILSIINPNGIFTKKDGTWNGHLYIPEIDEEVSLYRSLYTYDKPKKGYSVFDRLTNRVINIDEYELRHYYGLIYLLLDKYSPKLDQMNVIDLGPIRRLVENYHTKYGTIKMYRKNLFEKFKEGII